MQVFRKSLKLLDDKFEYILVALLLTSFTCLIFYEVCMRYLFHSPTDWTEELSRYIFVYMSYIAAALAVKRNQHIKVDIIRQYLPPLGQKIVDLFGHLCMIILSIVIMVTTLQIMKMQLEMEQLAQAWTLIELNFNMAYAYAALPFSCILIILRSAQMMYIRWKED